MIAARSVCWVLASLVCRNSNSGRSIGAGLLPSPVGDTIATRISVRNRWHWSVVGALVRTGGAPGGQSSSHRDHHTLHRSSRRRPPRPLPRCRLLRALGRRICVRRSRSSLFALVPAVGVPPASARKRAGCCAATRSTHRCARRCSDGRRGGLRRRVLQTSPGISEQFSDHTLRALRSFLPHH